MRSYVPLALTLALVLLAQMPGSSAATAIEYVGQSAVVVKPDSGSPAVDDGALVCNTHGASIGGGCLPFGEGDSIAVRDDALGNAVAFQVCVDNNGDGLCGGGGGGGGSVDRCGDDVFFSHDDQGRFFNPLGPLPSSFRTGCPGGGWAGYVVFLCAGVHGDASGAAEPAHSHGATHGTIGTASGGTGFGDFCAPRNPGQVKAYSVV